MSYAAVLALASKERLQQLSDFRPPYELGARGCVVVGVWRSRDARVGDGSRRSVRSPMDAIAARGLDGYAPVRVPGGHLGMGFVLHYDRPPQEHPVVYREIIAAIALRRGARWAALPFDLVLDDEFNVRAGQQHYHLPKRLDPTLRVDIDGSRLCATARDVNVEAELGPRGAPSLRGLSSLVLRSMTELGPIVGGAASPAVFASIPIRPDPNGGRTARIVRFDVGPFTLKPFRAQFWDSMAITLGAPRPASGEHSCPVTEVSRAPSSS